MEPGGLTVFIFDSLMREMPEHWRLQEFGARFVGEAALPDALAVDLGGFAGAAIRDPRMEYAGTPWGASLQGEVYTIPQESVKNFYDLYTNPCFPFHSRAVTVRMTNGTLMDVETFRHRTERPNNSRITDWREYMKNSYPHMLEAA